MSQLVIKYHDDVQKPQLCDEERMKEDIQHAPPVHIAGKSTLLIASLASF
jgi:hypothetical protein